ncbi:MAG: PQQ-dependent sugar dehydrogenase [Acidobacteriia bacterium]|nr:PQQ-dependent sugar dehydrogenase [Terriglobia bacterium]
MKLTSMRLAIAMTAALLAATGGWAQETRNRPPLGDGPWTFDTFEPNTRIRVSIVAKGLSHPYGLAFLPGGDILVTERPGRLRIIHQGVLDPKPIAGTPVVRAAELGGLLDLALSPKFSDDHLVYMTYSKQTDKGVATSVASGRWDGKALVDTKDVFVTDPSGGKRVAGSRLIFGRDGNLFFSVGGAGENNDTRAQQPGSAAGKILRIRPDGSVPPDNPFVGKPGYLPEIYSMGHRNPTGLAIHPDTGVLWEGEQGPQGGDEVNIIVPGKNYGWPVVTYGRDYDGTFMTKQPWRADFEAPMVFWVPSIATAGMTFYTGDKFPAWKGNLFVSGMVEARIPNSGQVQRIVLNKDGEIRREAFFRDFRQRIRDVSQSPDGYLYVLTDEDPGVVLKIEPAP